MEFFGLAIDSVPSQRPVERILTSTEGNKVNKAGREAGPLLFVSFC
jgi:hypothetical protein